MSEDQHLDVPGYDISGPLTGHHRLTVGRARRLADGLPVALRLVRPARPVAGAVEEAAALVGVRHRHLQYLYDAVPVPGGERLALAVRPATGGTLRRLLARVGQLTPGQVVTVLQPVAGVLADLHEARRVHGDLTTRAVVFRSDGMPLVADLGLAAVVGVRSVTELEIGGGAGLPGEDEGGVAPEVREGFPATRESDVFQLGALAWTCLVGAPPPDPDRVGPGPLEALEPALPATGRELILRCLSPAPEDRPDAEEVAVVLSRLTVPEPVEVDSDEVAGGVAAALREGVREGTRRGRTRPVRTPRTRRSKEAIGAVGVLLLAVAATWTVVQGLPGGDGGGTGDGHEIAPAVVTQTPQQQAETLTDELQHLLDRRAHAWEKTDPELLEVAVATGSPAWESESADLARARELGVLYPGLRFEVHEAEIVSEDGERRTLRASVRRTTTAAVDASGAAVTQLPAETRAVQIELVRRGDDWRLWSWEPA